MGFLAKAQGQGLEIPKSKSCQDVHLRSLIVWDSEGVTCSQARWCHTDEEIASDHANYLIYTHKIAEEPFTKLQMLLLLRSQKKNTKPGYDSVPTRCRR